MGRDYTDRSMTHYYADEGRKIIDEETGQLANAQPATPEAATGLCHGIIDVEGKPACDGDDRRVSWVRESPALMFPFLKLVYCAECRAQARVSDALTVFTPAPWTFHCRSCNERVWASEESIIDAVRPNDTDFEIVNTFDICFRCLDGNAIPGERIQPSWTWGARQFAGDTPTGNVEHAIAAHLRGLLDSNTYVDHVTDPDGLTYRIETTLTVRLVRTPTED